jgi:hypothetical protein
MYTFIFGPVTYIVFKEAFPLFASGFIKLVYLSCGVTSWDVSRLRIHLAYQSVQDNEDRDNLVEQGHSLST